MIKLLTAAILCALATTTAARPEDNPAIDRDLFKGGFLFVTKRKTHDDAAAYCKSKRMWLASINSEWRNKFFVEQIATLGGFGGFGWWTGGVRVSSNEWKWENEWKSWTTNPTTAGDTRWRNWRKNEPNNHNSHLGNKEDCIEITDNYDIIGVWNDIRCDVRNRFICEIVVRN